MTTQTIKKFRRFRTKRKEEPKKEIRSIPELDDLLEKMSNMKRRGKEDAAAYLTWEARAIDLMSQHEIEEYQGRKVVSGSTTKLNVDLLRRKINDKQWAAITKQVIDSDLLKAALKRGDISAEVVRMCTTEEPRKAYIYGN